MNFDELQTFYKTEDGVLFSRLLSEKLLKIQSGWFKIDSQKKANFLAIGYPFNIRKIKIFSLVLTTCKKVIEKKFNSKKQNISFTSASLWPISNDYVDNMLIIHALEFTSDNKQFLSEAYRTLASSGQLILCIPNRRGFWSKNKLTPLAFGTSYSEGQIKKLLLNEGFKIKKIDYCIFIPPILKFIHPNLKIKIDYFGNYFWKWLGGILIVEATKMVYVMPNQNINKTKNKYKNLLINKPARVFQNN